jgi:replicative DNA helicase
MPETGVGGRIPPQNLEAEVSVLGAMLQDQISLLRCTEILRPDDFYKRAHGTIFRVCGDLVDRSEPVDLVTVGNELLKQKRLEEVGGAAYLAYLVDSVPTAANAEYHARIVKDKSLLRSLISGCTVVVDRAFSDTEEVGTILDWGEQQIFDISQNRLSKSFTPVKKLIKGTIDYVEKLYERKAHVTGVPTGFRKLDELTAGLQPSDLIIVAGRPSMGKTSFALNVALNAALSENSTIGIFSLEMSNDQLVQRMLCTLARVNSNRMRTGFLLDSDWPKLTTQAGRLSETNIFVDDTPGISVLEMRAKSRRLKAENKKLDLIVVDYLQLITGRARIENRQQEISEISRSLKAMAKELDVPVVALSQLSRAVESREDKRPQLSDLRESGAIEQDADVVLFLYRPGAYRKDPEPRDDDDNTVEVIVGKQRNGPTGSVPLAFLKEWTRFEDQERQRDEL